MYLSSSLPLSLLTLSLLISSSFPPVPLGAYLPYYGKIPLRSFTTLDHALANCALTDGITIGMCLMVSVHVLATFSPLAELYPSQSTEKVISPPSATAAKMNCHLPSALNFTLWRRQVGAQGARVRPPQLIKTQNFEGTVTAPYSHPSSHTATTIAKTETSASSRFLFSVLQQTHHSPPPQ